MYRSEHMFASREMTDALPPARTDALAVRVRPTSTSRTRVLAVPGPLVPCLPDGGLRRGTIVHCSGPGSLSLALALIGPASATGSWCALVGVEDLGVLAATGYGVDLERLAVLHVAPPQWAVVAGMLLDGMDVVVAQSSSRFRPATARQLAARARCRRAVLLVVGSLTAWPALADVRLGVAGEQWQGLGRGSGHLSARRVSVVVQGHGSGARPVRRDLWLPDPTGQVAAV